MVARAVLFDLDDTLLWDERSVAETFAVVCEAAERAAGVNAAQLEETVRSEAKNLYMSYETYPFTKNIGINPIEGLWADFRDGEHPMFRKLQQLAPSYRSESWTRGLARLGVFDESLGKKLGEMFYKERRERPIVYEDTFAILDALKGTCKLLLLTNGAPDLQRDKLEGVPALIPYFDRIVISGDFGQGKPSSALFEYAMGLIGITADEGVMVGDKLTTDIQGANGVGMTSVWLNRKQIPRQSGIVPEYEIRGLMELLDIVRSK